MSRDDGEDLLRAFGIDTVDVMSADLHIAAHGVPTLTVRYAVTDPAATDHARTRVYELRDVTPLGVESYKLGKLAHRSDDRTLRLATYLEQPLPTPPVGWGVLHVPDWPMYGNDRLGDCTCAAAGHMVECWTAEQGRAVDVPESAVVGMYEAITGGQDTGAVELDVLRYWQKNGLAGHRPYAFALIDRNAHEHVKLAASLFAGVYLGIALPVTAQSQTGPGKVWDVPSPNSGSRGAPGSWGGHAVNVVAYDATGLTVITWGQQQRMTWAFWDRYVDECWALMPADWATKAPEIPGFNFAAFARDLARVGREES